MHNKKFEKKYKVKDFLNLKNLYGSKRKYLNLDIKIKSIFFNEKINYQWFIIVTNQISYSKDYMNFIKSFRKNNFNNIFNLFIIKINYADKKDFNIKIFGLKSLFSFLEDFQNFFSSKKIIYSDLDLEINKSLKNLILTSEFNFLNSFKVLKTQKAIGALFFGKQEKFLILKNDIDKYLQSDLIFNYEDEKILFSHSDFNLYQKAKIYLIKDNKNFLSDCRYIIK